MEDMTIFNLCAVHKGALKATVSIRLASGLIIHDCKILQQDGVLSAKLPQRPERQKGGEVVYHDLVEFGAPGVIGGKFTVSLSSPCLHYHMSESMPVLPGLMCPLRVPLYRSEVR